MNGKALRFRRFDSRNFVIEQAYGKQGQWRVLGYYPSPEAMCRSAIRMGIDPDCAGEILSTVEGAVAVVVEVLAQAIADGTLQLGGKSPKAREKRTATKDGANLGATDDKDA